MKKIMILLICVLLVSTLAAGVSANGTANMTITPSKTTANQGDEITFTVSVSQLDACTSAGIILSYNTSLYEMGSWECLISTAIMPSYDPATKLLSFANQGNALSGDIFRFTLKVKMDAKAGAANVSGTPYLRNSAGAISATVNAASVTIACKHSYDNGCDTSCNICGASRTAVHSWNAGKVTKEPSCTEKGSKTLTCTVCGETKTESVNATGHTYSNDCDATCNSCGEQRSVTHSYSNKWSSDKNQHWHACGVCGAKKDEAKHTPGAAATTQTPQTCTVCGYVLQPALGHTHNYEETWTKDVIGHWHACTSCDEIQDFENHVYDSDCDATCDTCGHIRAAEHTYMEQWMSDSDGHWHACSICGDKLEKEKHEPGPEATTETPQICIVCGFELTPIVGHTHEYTWKFSGERHWQQCICGHTMGETTEHIWDQGVVTKEPGENQTGIMTYTCICGEQHTKQIPATGKPQQTEPSGEASAEAEAQKGMVTLPLWLLLAVGIGVAALCALFLIVGIIIGRKQAERYMN